MNLNNFAKYKLNKESLLEINAGGHGLVICANGESFSGSADSEDSVNSGGARWCRDRGGARLTVFLP